MRKLKEILGGIWKIYVFVCFCLVMVLLYPFYAMWLMKEKSFHKGFRLMQWHTKMLLFLGGIAMEVKHQELIKKGQPYIIVPNHSSYLDIPVLYQTFPFYFVFMGKKELLSVPLFNIFFKKMNIPVDRRSVVSGKNALDRCGDELEKGNSVIIFPEGTISDACPQLLRFKNGAFKLAIEKQVPLLPITFLTNYKRLEMAGLFSGKAGPGKAKAIIHEPISTSGMTPKDLIPLRESVFQIINNQLLSYERRQ